MPVAESAWCRGCSSSGPSTRSASRGPCRSREREAALTQAARRSSRRPRSPGSTSTTTSSSPAGYPACRWRWPVRAPRRRRLPRHRLRRACGRPGRRARRSTGATARLRGGAVWARRGEVLAVHAPGNAPGVHGLWPQALALGYRVAIRPSRREPFTAHRLDHGLARAGFRDAGRAATCRPTTRLPTNSSGPPTSRWSTAARTSSTDTPTTRRCWSTAPAGPRSSSPRSTTGATTST